MKTLPLRIMVAVSFVTTLIVGTSYAVPSGPPQFEFGLELDKVLYKPGDTIMIHVWGAGATPDNSTVYLKIRDATSDIRGTSVIFQDAKNLTNNELKFNYTIPTAFPTSTQSHRFLVEVYQHQEDSIPINGVYFVTMDGAQRLKIPSVNIQSSTVKPEQLINFTTKITDGLGQVIPNLIVWGDLPQTDGYGDYLSGRATFDNSTNLYKGSIKVPGYLNNYLPPNQIYYLRIIANPQYLGPEPYDHNYSKKGIVPIQIRNGTIQIIVENPCTTNSNNPTCIKGLKIDQVHLYNSYIGPGDRIRYDIDVRDNKNNPFSAQIDAELFYQASWGPSNLHGIGGYDESKKLFWGEITLPDDFVPGNYTIDLFLPGNTDFHKPDGQIPVKVSSTNVIPEFPFVIPILLISITSLIVFYRMRFRK